MYGVKYIGLVSLMPHCVCRPQELTASAASESHRDLGRAPYVLYGVKYIDLVSLGAKERGRVPSASGAHLDLDLGRAPHCFVSYGVKYIDLVSLG